jgi:DNA-binding beta-propeller fold protein YncE
MSRSTKRVFSLLSASAAVLCAVSGSPVQANDLFFTTTGFGAELIAIHGQNDHNFTTALIGATGGGNCLSLALSPLGTLYSMCGSLFGEQKLATLDRGNGHANVFGVGVSGLAVMSLTFGPDGTLYAVGNCNPGPTECTPGPLTYNSLYKVDVRNGLFTHIGPTGAPLFFMDLAFDRDGNMYGVTCSLSPSGGPLSTLYRISLANNGKATKVVDLVGSTSIMGLSFDRENNKLYATDFYSVNSALYLVDIKTGFLTPVATMGYGHSSNLVSVPATNESERDN